MIKIAHRGNTEGPCPSRENTHNHIKMALKEGYHVEVDIWYNPLQGFSMGHDYGRFQTDESFLEIEGIICHAKSIPALHKMLDNPKIHCFWHENDQVTLTSRNWIWKFPEVYKDGEIIGICSDWL